MRNLILIMTLCGALYVLWGMEAPPPASSGAVHDSVDAVATSGGERSTEPRPRPRREVAPQGTHTPGELSHLPHLDAPPPGVDPLNETIVDAPLDEPLPKVTPKPWVPARSDEALSAYGLMGLYTGWLKEAERIGWTVSSDALSATREGVTIHFNSKDGMLQSAEVNFAPDALSDMAMDLPHTLLGSEAVRLSIEPPYEREEPGWSESRRVALPSGRSVDVILKGRSTGEAPFGPERLSVEITALLR